MTKTVKSIKITFENLDHVVIPAHYFGHFSISHIGSDICRVAANAILKIDVAGEIEFELPPLINNEIFDLKHDIPGLSPEYSLFDRFFAKNDITLLTVVYMDDSAEKYYVPWEDAEHSEYQNRLQHTFITASGGLCVRINESPTE